MNRIVVTVFALSLCATVAAAQPPAWIGTWKLNLGASTFRPGPAIRAQTTTIAVTERTVTLTAEGIDAVGKPTRTAYTATIDGGEAPYKGGIAADAIAFTRIDDRSFEVVYKLKGQVVLRSHNAF